MYYCPECQAQVSAQAHFCPNCGYKPTTAAIPQVQPHTPPVVLSIAPVPTRSVQPTVKHVPSRLHTNYFSHEGANMHQPGNSEAADTVRPVRPASQKEQPEQQQPSSAGLIRPIGLTSPKLLPAPTPTEQLDRDNLVPPQSTPAHLLALTPVTPPAVPKLRQHLQAHTPLSGKSQGQQFMRPGFMAAPAKEQKLLAEQIHEQRAQPSQQSSPSQPEEPVTLPLSASLASSSTMPPPQSLSPADQPTGPMPSLEIVKGRSRLIDTSDIFDDTDEGFVVASKAAEHWRTSWRDRQRSEAGPATTVSRGQSAVPEPLLAMQQSLMRIRAVVVPQRMQQKQQSAMFGFWITLFLLVSLIGGLTAYIAYTYLPNTNGAAHFDVPVDTPQPSLSLVGTQVISIVQGQALHLHGGNFNAGAPIIFLLDSDTAISDTNGKQVALLASDQGSFDVTVPTFVWSVGTHVILAQDNKDGESAYLNIQVDLKAPAATATTDVVLSVFPTLTFQAMAGQRNPPTKVLTLTNKNTTTPLSWTVRATTADNLSWLIIDPATTSGSISIGGTDRLRVRVDITGLRSRTQPYTGHIVFTLNNTEQLTLAVELQVQNAAAEIVISPNPLVGMLDGLGSSCQANSQLLLVNISNVPVSWSINLSDRANQHIQFMHAGAPAMQGQLAPTGQQGDTEALTLQCIQVQNGQVYSFTVTANNISWPATVSLQRA